MVEMDKNVAFRPLLLMAYVDSAHAAQCGRYFRRHGWEVRLAPTAAEARRILEVASPRAIVLDTELPDESGWLTCAKLTHEDPERKVVLLAPDRSELPESSPETLERLGQVNAAALVSRDEPIEILAESILGERFAEAI
jgi:CheY-like chemotaxis protein